MLKTIFIRENRRGQKSIDLPQYPDEAWNWYTGKPASGTEIAASVAAVFAGVELTKNAASAVPWAITKGGNDFDLSDDYQNKLGWLPNPDELIKLWVESRLYTNRAYGFIERKGRSVSLLRYIAPSTITIQFDTTGAKGITGFKRTIGSAAQTYSIEQNVIFHHFRLDHTTELLPNDNTAVRAMLESVGVLYYSEFFANEFLKGGGIKPTMLLVKGANDPAQVEKLENVWEKFTRGMWRTIGKVFEKDAVEPVPVGEGLENLKKSELYTNAIRNVCLALGIPQSVMLQDAANYATAQVYQSSWYSNTIVPTVQELAKDLNEQVFEPAGYHFDLRPHQAEPDKAEETERAAAYAAYVNAGMQPSIAAQVVGVDLPEGVEYEDLDPEEPPEAPETNQAAVPAQPVQPEQPEQMAVMSLAQMSKLIEWRDIARRKLKRGEPLPADFTATLLPERVTAFVTDGLKATATADEIDALFETAVTYAPAPEYEPESEIKILAAAMNRLAESVAR